MSGPRETPVEHSIAPDGAGSGLPPASGPVVFGAWVWRVVRGPRPGVLLAGIALGAILGLAIRMIVPRKFETQVAFMPEPTAEASKGLAAFAGLASQFGIALGGAQAGQSPQFYGDLVVSRTVLDWVLRQPDRCGGPVIALRHFYTKREDSDPKSVRDARKKLRRAMDVTVNARTSVVTVSVRTKSA